LRDIYYVGTRWMGMEFSGVRMIRGSIRGLLGLVVAGCFVGVALGQSPESVGPPTVTPHKTTKPRPSGTSSNANTNGADVPPDATPKANPVLRSPGDNPITTEPPSMAVDDIIKKFSDKESEFKRERANYTYTQTFSIQTIDEDSNRPDGEYRMTSDIVFTPDGKRFEKVTYAPAPTLQRIMLSEQDLDDLRNIQPFVLNSDDLPKYNVKYVGRQQVDDLATYVFDVGPKVMEKNQRYFQGRVWVDDKDMQIVMTDGKAVPDIITKNNENVFPRFRTYRQNIEHGYWFPVFTQADDYLHFRTGPVHIRMTVKYSNYKRNGSTVKMGAATEVK
jgi:hypothetical protein